MPLSNCEITEAGDTACFSMPFATTAFELFQEDIAQDEFEFFKKHLDAFKTMWTSQTKESKKLFVKAFYKFSRSHGVIKELPSQHPHLLQLVKKSKRLLMKLYVEDTFASARRLIFDCAIFAQHRGSVLPNGKGLPVRAKDPFYIKESRESFRKIFGEPTEDGTFKKMLITFPIYLKFGGAVCRYLKQWLERRRAAPTSSAGHFESVESAEDRAFLEHLQHKMVQDRKESGHSANSPHKPHHARKGAGSSDKNLGGACSGSEDGDIVSLCIGGFVEKIKIGGDVKESDTMAANSTRSEMEFERVAFKEVRVHDMRAERTGDISDNAEKGYVSTSSLPLSTCLSAFPSKLVESHLVKLAADKRSLDGAEVLAIMSPRPELAAIIEEAAEKYMKEVTKQEYVRPAELPPPIPPMLRELARQCREEREEEEARKAAQSEERCVDSPHAASCDQGEIRGCGIYHATHAACSSSTCDSSTADAIVPEAVAERRDVLSSDTNVRAPTTKKLHSCSFCRTREQSYKQYKKCPRCKGKGTKFYCGRECQERHWVAEHHKAHLDV